MTTAIQSLGEIDFTSITDAESGQLFRERIAHGRFTKDEDSLSHICAYTLPYNPSTHQVFLGHHKKAKLWLTPGGHVDHGETLAETVVRELREELDMHMALSDVPTPFFASITDIDNPPQVCRRHYDLWHLIKTDGRDFTVDPREYHETRWLSWAEVQSLVTDSSNLQVIERIMRPRR